MVASARGGVVSCVAIGRTYLCCAAEYERATSGLDLCHVRRRYCGSAIRYRRPHFITSQRQGRGTLGRWMRPKSALDFCRAHACRRNIWSAALEVMRNRSRSMCNYVFEFARFVRWDLQTATRFLDPSTQRW